MRILLSAYACEPNRGSEPGIGWNWAFYLAEAGHTVHLLTRPHGRGAIEDVLYHRPAPNLHVYYVDVPKWVKGYLKGQLGVVTHYVLWQRAALRVARRLRAKIDVVHHVTWGSLRLGSQLWKLRMPFVFGPAGGGQVAPEAFRELLGKARYLEGLRTALTRLAPYSPTLRAMLSYTDLVLATNQETLDLAKRAGARRVELFLDTGLPESFFPPEPPRREFSNELRVLWVGRIYARKGLPLALLAVRKAINMGVPVRLTIVGDGPLGPKVQEWVQDYGLEGRVDWWGQVSWAKVREAYASHDVFLFTSLRDSFGSQLLEAMAFGLPIVTLDHQGARQWVPDAAGIKVRVADPDETSAKLATALASIWMAPKKAQAMGCVGFRFALGQTWPQRVVRMTALYELVLQGHRVRMP